MDDLVIRGGTVVDGTGAPGRTADVAVSEGRIREIGSGLPRGRREIEAGGLLVAPGWVDVHTHYDGNALWDPLLSPSSGHGVTTVVTGNCGVGFAPVRAADHDWTIRLMEGVEDIPGEVMRRGLSWEWETFPQYLDALDRVPRAIDVATLVPHAALRVYAMGERGIDHHAVATADDIELMGELAADAILAGALGLSTSRSTNHKASDGRPTPTLTASLDELAGIARAIGRTGRGVFECNYDPADPEAGFPAWRAMCEASGRPLSVSAVQRPGKPDSHRIVLRGLEQAVADGFDMKGQVAARPVGLLLSLRGRVNPLRASQTFQSLGSLNHAELLRALQRPEIRGRIVHDLMAGGDDPMDRFAHAFEPGDTPRWDADARRSIRALAAERGVKPIEVAYDVLARDGFVYVPAQNYVEGNLDAVREMLAHPLTVPGLGDGGAHCTMIADFDFPTFLLSYWARDVAEEQRFPIEWVFKRQCADTAELVGLTDRGVLAPGTKADINLIDYATVGSGAPRLVDDLPAGGARLVSSSRGYVATIVRGEVAFENGVHTGALAGTLVRGANHEQHKGIDR